MSKTIQILLVVSGIGLAIWLISKMTPKQGQTVVVPTRSTGTASPLEDFFGAFRRVPTAGVGAVRYDNTGEKIQAIGGIIKEIPGVFKGLGDAWKSWSGSTPKASANTTFESGSSYEDFYATNGYR